MNGENMMRGMGEIWDSLIDEAEYEMIEKKKGANYMKYLASAAIFMTITGTALLGSMYFKDQNDTPLTQSGSESVTQTEIVSEGETAAETSLLPMEENEYLAVTVKDNVTGEDVLVILDNDGNTINIMEGYSLKEYVLTGESAVVSGEKPLMLEYISKTCINEEGIYSVPDEGWIHTGIYSIENRDWIQEPYYGNLILLSDTLCTNRDDKFTSGKLMKLDGSVITEGIGNGLHMIRRIGNLISDGVNLYDLEGNYMFKFGSEEIQPGKFGVSLADAWDKYILISDDTSEHGGIKLMTQDGATLWTEQSGLGLRGYFGDLWSWVDSNNSGLITDMKLNPVLSETEFRQANAGTEINGTGMILVSVNENGERLIQTSEAMRDYWYYRCDESWKILEAYPKNRVYLEKQDGTTIPWGWQIDDSGTFRVTNLWSGESVSWKQDGITAALADDLATSIQIDSEASVISTYYFANGNYCMSVNTTAGYHKLHVSPEHFNVAVTRADEDMVVVRAANGVFSVNEELYYFDTDGTYLGNNGNGVLYISEDMTCVQNGQDLVISDAEGNVLVTVSFDREGGTAE